MVLLGLIFNRWLLKLIIIIIAVFLLLQVLLSLVSFASQLPAIQVITLSVIAASILTALSARTARFRSLSSLSKFLGLAVVPSLLVYEAVGLLFPFGLLATIATFTIPFLPYVVYFALRTGIWSLSNPANPQIRGRLQKLTMSSFAPRGIETGHVVFSAGRRGFRTLRFIEIQYPELQEHTRRPNFLEAQSKIIKTLSTTVVVARRLSLEFSFELHWGDGTLHTVVVAISEGRGYRRCRSLVDEFTRKLIQHPNFHDPRKYQLRQIADTTEAEEVLMMPLFLDLAELRSIETDDRNLMLTSSRCPDKRIRLRVISVSGISQVSECTGRSLLDDLIRIVITNHTVLDVGLILHIKPFPDSYLQSETKKLEEAYRSAMARTIEEINRKMQTERGLAMSLLAQNRRDSIATPFAGEMKTRLRQLRDAQSSGYFGVDMKLVGEPAAVESIARQLRTGLTSLSPDLDVCIDHPPPTVFQEVIRRDSPVFYDKLGGNELTIVLTHQESILEQKSRGSQLHSSTLDSSVAEQSVTS